jgi:hypothetical protein
VARNEAGQTSGIAEIEKPVAVARKAAAAAGYNLEKYLAAFKPLPVKTR